MYKDTPLIHKNRLTDKDRQAFQDSLESFSEANPLIAETHKKTLMSSLDRLTDSIQGLKFIYDHIDALTASGLFRDTSWDDPARLIPSLVTGTLNSGGSSTLMEILSELRMLAIAEGRIVSKRMKQRGAREFLEETLVHNLDWLFAVKRPRQPVNSSDLKPGTTQKNKRLFRFLGEKIPVESIKGKLAREIELSCAQRPVVTDRIINLITIVNEHIPLNQEGDQDQKLQRFVNALFSPSEMAGQLTPEAYHRYLKSAKKDQLFREAQALGHSMATTGLAVDYHAILLRQIDGDRKLLATALALDSAGKAELDTHYDFVRNLIDKVIHRETARSCYGLARLLERSLLSHQPVKIGLDRLLTLTLHPETINSILKSRPDCTLAPEFLLAADCVGVMGQPLGIGQGWNPTCQSARGISLWSSHAPGKLLKMIENTAKSNQLSMRFESSVLKSEELTSGLIKKLDYNLDAVSVVLVPHLDKLYFEMMRLASGRADDPHKWVNPAMYGHWIPTGFVSAYDYVTNTIKNYDAFVRTFYATHHPDYNGGHDLTYPNPVGIFLTSSTGKLIGFHAVSILRVRRIKGQVRVFLLNPNNEGRQRWQEDISPTVTGNGERPGESSLPFHQFASRLYAFHFNPSDLGNLADVDDALIKQVTELSKKSWGDAYIWT